MWLKLLGIAGEIARNLASKIANFSSMTSKIAWEFKLGSGKESGVGVLTRWDSWNRSMAIAICPCCSQRSRFQNQRIGGKTGFLSVKFGNKGGY